MGQKALSNGKILFFPRQSVNHRFRQLKLKNMFGLPLSWLSSVTTTTPMVSVNIWSVCVCVCVYPKEPISLVQFIRKIVRTNTDFSLCSYKMQSQTDPN